MHIGLEDINVGVCVCVDAKCQCWCCCLANRGGRSCVSSATDMLLWSVHDPDDVANYVAWVASVRKMGTIDSEATLWKIWSMSIRLHAPVWVLPVFLRTRHICFMITDGHVGDAWPHDAQAAGRDRTARLSLTITRRFRPVRHHSRPSYRSKRAFGVYYPARRAVCPDRTSLTIQTKVPECCATCVLGSSSSRGG